MEHSMKPLRSVRLLGLAIALAAAAVLVAAAQAGTSSRSRAHPATGALVALRKTALGTILVDSRGRTLYLFEKDSKGMSMCNSACVSYWPPLTSHGTARAGRGVNQSMLGLTAAHNGVRQVTYAGHPLYTFVGDKHAGQTTGEGLKNFGARWYVLAANGKRVEPAAPAPSTGGGYGYGGGYSYGVGK
jgi:predicted lipoprotein with Yx(FWY)xxD motif